MRWIVSIVTALCLLAAANERPDPRYGDGDEQLTLDKHGATAWVSARRGGSAHHPRLDVFVATAAAPPAPARTRARAVATAFRSSPSSRRPCRSTQIRGPPLG